MQLQREIQQLDLMLKGYEEENLKLMKKQKEHDSVVKDLTLRLASESKLVKEYKLKALKEKNGVFVDEDDKATDVDMMTKNVMGSGNAISKTQLDELHNKIKELTL